MMVCLRDFVLEPRTARPRIANSNSTGARSSGWPQIIRLVQMGPPVLSSSQMLGMRSGVLSF